ncbi:glycosyltransferase family 4 protein [Halomicrococcus sp. SG-WS-1]|uniref:glycosyltransferase family 4 protein n=1 Tax=Halomicrococcus sp. SG-WS-1 TaxID=3439057 RepID=UPI003F79605C
MVGEFISGIEDFGNGSIQHVANKLYDAAEIRTYKVTNSSLPLLSGTDRLYRKVPKLMNKIDKKNSAIILARHTQLAGIEPRNYEAAIFPLVHDLDEYLSDDGNWLRKKALNHALSNLREVDRILATSDTTKQSIIRNIDIDPDQIEVLTQGVDPHRIYPDSTPFEGISIPDRYILYVGALIERKRPGFLLSVLEELEPDIEFVICGNQYNSNSFKKLLRDAERRGLKDRIHTLGYVSQPNLRRLYTNAEVYFHAAESEGYGRTPVEAAACSTPVVLYKSIPSAKDLGDVSRTFDEFDPAEVASKIEVVAGEEVQYTPRTWDEVATELKEIIEPTIDK